MNIKDLERCFNKAISEAAAYIGVKIQMEGYPKPETIINEFENFDKKLEYYKNAYNEDLTLKAFNGIKIIGFAYADFIEDINDEILEFES